jgi:DNA-binding PadR family transcriptional regulator
MVGATGTDRIHAAAQSADLAVLTLLRDRPHPTEYLAVAAKTQGIALYEGNVYETLMRLIDQGLVEREWGRGGNGVPQRFYRLTPEGEARLRALGRGD